MPLVAQNQLHRQECLCHLWPKTNSTGRSACATCGAKPTPQAGVPLLLWHSHSRLCKGSLWNLHQVQKATTGILRPKERASE
jgi:hypothetical protein